MGLIAWFMALTRFEPSVLRAGVMAMLAATAFALGHAGSAGATGGDRGDRAGAGRSAAGVVGGVLAVGGRHRWGVHRGAVAEAPACRAPVGWRLPVAVTLGAQAGVALPSLLVFGRLPVISVVANLSAVPVAGFGDALRHTGGAGRSDACPHRWRMLVMIPADVGTRWVATVARVAAALEPPVGWRRWRVMAARGRRWWRPRCRRWRAAAAVCQSEGAMAIYLITGDDESLVLSAIGDLVKKLVGDGDRTLMVDDFDGEDFEVRRRRRRRPDPAVPHREAGGGRQGSGPLQRRRRGSAGGLPRRPAAHHRSGAGGRRRPHAQGAHRRAEEGRGNDDARPLRPPGPTSDRAGSRSRSRLQA